MWQSHIANQSNAEQRCSTIDVVRPTKTDTKTIHIEQQQQRQQQQLASMKHN